jgi:hypothetical protein
MDNALDALKEGRAIPAKMDDLDAVGDKYIPVLDRLVTRIKGLDTYYKSRAYLDDNMARGRREDPLVLADFQTLTDGIGPLSAAIDHEQDKRDQRVLDAMKSDGDQIGYDGELAMQRSKALLRLFHDKADLADPAKIRQGDADVAQIEQAIAEERKLLAEAKANPTHDYTHSMRNSGNESAAGYLESFIGDYRQLKLSGSPTDHQQMVIAYNQAVEQVNMMH